MKLLEKVNDMIKEEIRPLTNKSDISPQELQSLGEAIDIIKDIKTIEAMENSNESMYYRDNASYNSYNSYGYEPEMSMVSNNSYRMNSYNMSNDGRRGRDGDNDGRYSEGYNRSYRYSGHEEKEHTVKKLESMMREAKSESERRAIEDCIKKLEMM